MSNYMYFSLGDFGCNTTLEYLKKLEDDHQLSSQTSSSEPLGNTDVFMEKTQNGQQIFRGIFCGNEQVINKLNCSPQFNYLNQDNLFKTELSKNVGIFHSGKNCYDNQIEDKSQRMIERCDRLQCVNFLISTYDSFSGLSCKVIDKFRDNWYYGYTSSTFALFPNANIANQIEIYNFTFSVNTLTEQTDQVFVYDYGALERQTQKLGKDSSINNYNSIISETILQMDSSLRFNGSQNGSLLKIGTNLKPFHRINYIVSSFAQFNLNQDIETQMRNLTLPQNSFFTFNKNGQSSYFTQAFITRHSNIDIDFQEKLKGINNSVKWVSNNKLHINCKKEHPQLGQAALFLDIFIELFKIQYQKKAFVHYYLSEGADEQEFQEAQESLQFISSQYQSYGYDVNDSDQYDE